jgi:hypothetical protein
MIRDDYDSTDDKLLTVDWLSTAIDRLLTPAVKQ